MQEHKTQHLVVLADDGTPLYSLINNHGPDNAHACLHGHDDHPGWLAHAEQALGRSDACVVLDLDLTTMDRHAAEGAMRSMRIRANIGGRKGARQVEHVEFFHDDAKTQRLHQLPVASAAKVIEAPAGFAHDRFDLRGQRKAPA